MLRIQACRAALRVASLGRAYSEQLVEEYTARMSALNEMRKNGGSGKGGGGIKRLRVLPVLDISCGVHKASSEAFHQADTRQTVYQIREKDIEVACELTYVIACLLPKAC